MALADLPYCGHSGRQRIRSRKIRDSWPASIVGAGIVGCSWMGQRIKVGDVYEIPLPDRRYAYCQYVNWNDQMGFLVQVFDRIESQPLKIEELQGAKPLFPSVFVGL